MFASNKITASVEPSYTGSYSVLMKLRPNDAITYTLSAIMDKCAKEHKLDRSDLDIELINASVILCSLGEIDYQVQANATDLILALNDTIPTIPTNYRQFVRMQLEESMEMTAVRLRNSSLHSKQDILNAHVRQVNAVIRKFKKKEPGCFPAIHDFLVREKNKIDQNKMHTLSRIVSSAALHYRLPGEFTILEAYPSLEPGVLTLHLSNDIVSGIMKTMLAGFAGHGIAATFSQPTLTVRSQKGVTLSKEFAASVTRELQSLPTPAVIPITSDNIGLYRRDVRVLESKQSAQQAGKESLSTEFPQQRFGKKS